MLLYSGVRKQTVLNVEAAQLFVSFCGCGVFFQKRALVHSKNKAVFFPRVCDVTMRVSYIPNTSFVVILKRCCIEETAQL